MTVQERDLASLGPQQVSEQSWPPRRWLGALGAPSVSLDLLKRPWARLLGAVADCTEICPEDLERRAQVFPCALCLTHTMPCGCSPKWNTIFFRSFAKN